MIDVFVSIIRSLYVPDFFLFLFFCILILCFKWRVGLLFVLSIMFFFVWRIKAPIITSRYCFSIQIFYIISLAYALKVVQIKQIKRIIVSFIFLVLISHFFLSFSGSRNNYLFCLMEDTAFFLSHDKEATILIEEKEYDRILYSPQKNNQIVLCHPPQTYEDLDSIYYQYDFWNNNAYLVFSEKGGKNSAGTLKKCLYNSNTILKKTRNYIKSKKQYISVYFHEKFIPSSFEDLKTIPALNSIICNGTLKSCSPFFETYIYQLGNKLIWIVGADLQSKDKIIYLLFPTNQVFLSRKRFKDNRSFYADTKNETGRYGKYKVFERSLPNEYPVREIDVGYLINQNKTLFKPFYLSLSKPVETMPKAKPAAVPVATADEAEKLNADALLFFEKRSKK